MTFKVGDKIRGISDNFEITNKAMTLAEVMSVEPLGIKIKILEHTNKSQIGKICLAITLEELLAHFELVEEKEMDTLETLEKKYKELGEEIERLKNEQEEEAEFREEQLKVEAGLRRFARPFEENERNYTIQYGHDTNKIQINHFLWTQSTNICFASKKIAQKAIDTVGEERIKKYYFGVKDNEKF